MSAVFLDASLGPTAAEVRMAVEAAHGWPGAAIAALAGGPRRPRRGWVHETAPEYGRRSKPAQPVERRCRRGRAICRGSRGWCPSPGVLPNAAVMDARRVCSRAALARSRREAAATAAAAAACELGELLLDCGQPGRAADAFEQARGWTRDPALLTRLLIGAGRTLIERARLAEAEAVFRTAAAAGGAASPAQVWLARVLWHRGQFDEAAATVGASRPALLARILLGNGAPRRRRAGGARRASRPRPTTSRPAACEASLAAMHVHAALGDTPAVRHHAGGSAARGARGPGTPSCALTVAADVWARPASVAVRRCRGAPRRASIRGGRSTAAAAGCADSQRVRAAPARADDMILPPAPRRRSIWCSTSRR